MWEQLADSASDASSHRLKVPGGWIVRTVVRYYHIGGGTGTGAGCAVDQTFVSDPNHEWVLEKRANDPEFDRRGK